MAKKKRYVAWRCKDCEMDFYISGKSDRWTHCPKCGENMFTEKIKVVWLERPINYKRPWSEEETEIIESGLKLGKTHKEIAAELNGRTPKAVTRQIQQLRKRGLLV